MMKGHSHAFPGALQPTSSSSSLTPIHLSLPPMLNLSVSHLAFASSPLASVPSGALITSPSSGHPLTGWSSLPDTEIFSSILFDLCCDSLYSLLPSPLVLPIISYLPFNPHRYLFTMCCPGSLSYFLFPFRQLSA